MDKAIGDYDDGAADDPLGIMPRLPVREAGASEVKKPAFATIAELAGIGQRTQTPAADAADALDADRAERWIAKQARSQ